MSAHYLFIVILLLFGKFSWKLLKYLTTLCSDVDVKFKHQLLLIVGLIIPIFVLNVCASISNYPTLENEYLTNYELAQTLGLDNYTIKNYVVGLRSRVR